MIATYAASVLHALESTLDIFSRLALPLAICFGLAVVAAAVVLARQPEAPWLRQANWRALSAGAFGYVAVAAILVAGWAFLSTAAPLAREDTEWRQAAEATENPVPDAAAVYQAGPVIAALAERTYTRTLTLPPDFLQRIGEQGVGVLSPYLTDPSAENVLRLVDSFRRSGKDVVFTRQVTRMDEIPIPATQCDVRVRFQRLAGRAYDAEFEGRYTFTNEAVAPINARFLFPLPQAGTVRDISVNVGGAAVIEPNQNGAYEWRGQLLPRERREAVVRYRVVGGHAWHYDLGSQRRRVQQFRLEALTSGPVRFMRDSLHPSYNRGDTVRWELANVVTAQQVAIDFPPRTAAVECYIEALSSLPFVLLLFCAGVLAIGWWFAGAPDPRCLAAGLVAFAFGLAAISVLANYTGPMIATLLAPLAGALLAARVMGARYLLVGAPLALVPAAFLSPTHSGLIVLVIAVVALLTGWRVHRPREAVAAGAYGDS